MASIKHFEDLEAWQAARLLVKNVYLCCRSTPLGRDFGLRDQLCRAAVSGMSNIAEGFVRKSDREFARYLDISRASVAEVQSLLYVALDAEYIDAALFKTLFSLSRTCQSRVAGLTAYLRSPELRLEPDSLPDPPHGHETFESDFGPRTPDEAKPVNLRRAES